MQPRQERLVVHHNGIGERRKQTGITQRQGLGGVCMTVIMGGGRSKAVCSLETPLLLFVWSVVLNRSYTDDAGVSARTLHLLHCAMRMSAALPQRQWGGASWERLHHTGSLLVKPPHLQNRERKGQRRWARQPAQTETEWTVGTTMDHWTGRLLCFCV